MILGTTWVSPDEPCFALAEMNVHGRRIQFAYVVRGDRLAAYRQDLGAVIPAQQFRIPGGVIDERTKKIEIVETVGSLRDIADFLRVGRISEPDVQPSDLLGQWADQAEQRQWAARGRGLSILT